jgi:cytochrome b561
MADDATAVLLPEPPPRYHAALVTLHWISALLIMAALATGFLRFDKMPNSAPQKVPLLFWHTILEGVILFLLIARFTVRVRTPKPGPANNHPLLNRIAMLTHYALYAAIALMALSGLATAEMAGLPAIFIGTASGRLPASFDQMPTWIAHGVFARITAALVVFHVLAALYHVIVRRDGLLRRMWFDFGTPRPPTNRARVSSD